MIIHGIIKRSEMHSTCFKFQSYLISEIFPHVVSSPCIHHIQRPVLLCVVLDSIMLYLCYGLVPLPEFVSSHFLFLAIAFYYLSFSGNITLTITVPYFIRLSSFPLYNVIQFTKPIYPLQFRAVSWNIFQSCNKYPVSSQYLPHTNHVIFIDFLNAAYAISKM